MTLEPAVYGTKPDGTKDYNNMIKPAVKGTERVCQEQIDQLVGYTPATKTHLSSHLLVRARIKDDLLPLAEYDEHAIFFEDLTADYQYRCIISRKAMADYNYSMTMKIDYSSHAKEEMNRRSPFVAGRMEAYYSIWTALSKIQPNPPYGSNWTNYDTTTYVGGKKKVTDTAKPLTGFGSALDYYAGTKYAKKTPASNIFDLSQEGWEDIDPTWFDDEADTPDYDESLLEKDLKAGKASFESMRLQLIDLLDEINAADTVRDIDAAVEALVESFGTCDLYTVKDTDVLEVIYAKDSK